MRKMQEVYFDSVLECGAVIKNDMVVLPEDWTMTQLVKALKANGVKMFKLETMRVFAKV